MTRSNLEMLYRLGENTRFYSTDPSSKMRSLLLLWWRAKQSLQTIANNVKCFVSEIKKDLTTWKRIGNTVMFLETKIWEQGETW